MKRVILHAGFAKTGTTSLQVYLKENRRHLKGYLTLRTPQGMPGLVNAGRQYWRLPVPWRGWRFRREIRAVLDRPMPAPTVLFSWEGLAGPMPGYRLRFGWRAKTPGQTGTALIRMFVEEVRRKLGPETEVHLLFSLREKEAWLSSVYWHLVRFQRVTISEAEFLADHADLPTLEETATRIAAATPGVSCSVSWLEVTGRTSEGPASAVLDLLTLPPEVRAGLKQPRVHNLRLPADMRDRMLEMNRDGAGGLRTRKEALFKAFAKSRKNQMKQEAAGDA